MSSLESTNCPHASSRAGRKRQISLVRGSLAPVLGAEEAYALIYVYNTTMDTRPQRVV